MSEWWTYTLSDFLMFSPRVYYRLFELHNRALWPAQVLTAAVGLVILVLLLRPMRARERIIPALLGVLWVWIAWAFFFERYATINWGAIYVAPVFALQGVLLIGTGARGHLAFVCDRANVAGTGLLAFALAGYPLIAPLMGRPWTAAELFGIAPDPTSVATLAVLALASGRARWLLMVIPCLWCVVTGTTLWTMESPEFIVAPLGALAAVGIGLLQGRSERGEQGYGVHG